MELSFTPQDCFEHLVAESIDVDRVRKAAENGSKLRIKLGIDPTSVNIHLGRAIAVWRLRAFQELGHEIHLVIGDFTGQVGDASDKESERPMLSAETVQENMRQYEEQLWMILNPDKKDQVIFHRNSEWLAPLGLGQVSRLADAFSVNQFIKRELVAKRLESGSRVSLREMLYPVMQGYDSVMIKADIELGGTDQWFNLLAGRTLQEVEQQTPQAVITHPLINGLDGRKMSSSWGNVISLLDTPADKFGKMMAVRDDLLPEYLAIFPTSVQPFSKDELAQKLASENPRDLKLVFAHRLVELYHGSDAANQAQEQWTHQFSEKQLPADIPTLGYSSDALLSMPIIDVLMKYELMPSRSEARRLIDSGTIEIDGVKVTDPHQGFAPSGEKTLLKVGSRRYVYFQLEKSKMMLEENPES